MTPKHSREIAFTDRSVVVVHGNRNNPRTFWRMPTDLASWTEDMRYGMGLVDGRVVDVDPEHPEVIAALAGPRP